MEEEEVVVKKETLEPVRKQRLLLILSRVSYIVGILVVSLAVFILFLKIANLVYDKKRTLPGQEVTQGTVDVYGKKEKENPLTTFDTGRLSFEIQVNDPLSSGVIVRIQIVLAYDASKISSQKKGGPDLLSEELESRKSEIRDITRNLLIRKSYEELADHVGTERIKKELLNRINYVLVNGRISDIYLAQWDVIPR